MADAIIIGDGPGGLSAALFLAKAGKDVVVFGQDQTAMHAALLKNYLGIDEITGTDFQKRSRAQVERFGAKLRDERVTAVEKTTGGFSVTTEGGESLSCSVLLLSEGSKPTLAKTLGLEPLHAGRGLEVDRAGRTAVDGVYAIGRIVRPGRSQAIISAGDGAAAALDILSKEKGKDVCDWDTPE